MKSFIKTFGILSNPEEWKEESKQQIINLLKNALREEFNAWYGYTIVREHLAGEMRPDILKTYDELADDELKDHGYWLMKRINELGGTIEDITVSPNSWNDAVHKYRSPQWTSTANGNSIIGTLASLNINIENEKDAIATYNEIINVTQGIDWTTNSKSKEILADEEEHLQMLQDFVDDITSKNNCCPEPTLTVGNPVDIDPLDIPIEDDELDKAEI